MYRAFYVPFTSPNEESIIHTKYHKNIMGNITHVILSTTYVYNHYYFEE